MATIRSKAALRQSFSGCVYCMQLRWFDPIKVITLKTQQHAVNARWKRLSQLSLSPHWSWKVQVFKWNREEQISLKDFFLDLTYSEMDSAITNTLFSSKWVHDTNQPGCNGPWFNRAGSIKWRSWTVCISRVGQCLVGQKQKHNSLKTSKRNILRCRNWYLSEVPFDIS